MAFEDDMIEAGYSDEQEYLDSLIDEFEDNYNRQIELESQCEEYDSSYDEEMEYEREKLRLKQAREKKSVDEWEESNPDLAIIWCQYFNSISYLASIDEVSYRVNELAELKEWLNKREAFEAERQKEDWCDYIPKLNSLYQNELFEFYFPKDENHIDASIVSQQARELRLLESHEPTLSQYVSSKYRVDPKFFENIEVVTFWEMLYNREMDYEYWKDTYNEQYDSFAKQWIAHNYWGIIGEWKKKHGEEYVEWKNINMGLWEKYARNYVIREKNEIIKAKIEEFRKKANKESHVYEKRQRDRTIKGAKAINGVNYYCEPKPFLPDKENNSEVPFDTSTLDQKIRDYIEESLCSIDFDKLSVESSEYADKVLTQLWVFTNRDDWEMEEVKKHYVENAQLFQFSIDLFQHSKEDILDWWKEKNKTKWDDFINKDVSIFKKELETVLKFRQWALDGNKEVFFSLAEKYLIYWRKTIKLIHGYDIKEELSIYFSSEMSRINRFSWGEDVDYIKKLLIFPHPSMSKMIEIWKREAQDKVIWEVFFNNNYKEHFFIHSMYTSLKNDETLYEQ